MAELPIRDPRHVTAEQAVNRLRRALPEEWIVREQTSDYGIDVEIELAKTHMTGRIFKGQVKGHKRIVWNKDATMLQTVRQETLAYWRAMRVPVILFCVDLGTGEVAWSSATGLSSETGGIRVQKEQLLPKTLSRLESYLAAWMDAETARRQILAVPRIAARLARRQEQMDYDCFMPLEDEDFHDLSALYEEVLSLRQALGLAFSDILPWSLWLARARRVFGSAGGEMYWGIHDEVLLYIGSLAAEAIREAKQRLSQEPATPDNLYAKAFAADYTTRWILPTHFDEAGDAFWGAVEAQLQRDGALKFQRPTNRPRC